MALCSQKISAFQNFMKNYNILLIAIMSVVSAFLSGCGTVGQTIGSLFPPPAGEGQLVKLGSTVYESPVAAPLGGKGAICGSLDGF